MRPLAAGLDYIARTVIHDVEETGRTMLLEIPAHLNPDPEVRLLDLTMGNRFIY